MSSIMRKLNAKGDSALAEWDPTKEEEVAEARAAWDKAIVEEHNIAVVPTGPGQSEMIRDFDPSAAEIVVFAPMAGG